MRRFSIACATALALSTTPAFAAQANLQMVLELPGDAERNVITYRCNDTTTIDVDYLNAAPNFMAIVSVRGEELIFVSVISGSGVRYASNQYIWHTKGTEATLTDELAGPDAEPIANCVELIEAP